MASRASSSVRSDVSRSTAYRIIRRLNAELDKAGKITVAGKVSARYFYENTYL